MCQNLKNLLSRLINVEWAGYMDLHNRVKLAGGGAQRNTPTVLTNSKPLSMLTI
jgi:hypothetical protein